MKKLLVWMLAWTMAVGCCAVSLAEAKDTLDISEYMDKWVLITEEEKAERGETVYDENGNPVMVQIHPTYALKNVTYCTNPLDAEVQSLDIYVPEEYVNAVDNGDGTYTVTINPNGAITRGDVTYTALTAPIIYQNMIDGYREGGKAKLASGRKGGPGTMADLLEAGYVLVIPGARGTTSKVDGTAPAAITDLKAGVRYLKLNDALIPGSAEKIISVGGSAGGSCAALLAASGNSELYTAYLEAIGAADTSDDVYAATIFCPIADLDVGDAAYEYLHQAETVFQKGWGQDAITVEIAGFDAAVRDAMVSSYKEYLASIGLNPTEYEAAFLALINDCIVEYTARFVEDEAAFLAENPGLTKEGDAIVATDPFAFVAANMGRSKAVVGFDNFERNSNETPLFGGKHFSQNVLDMLTSLAGEWEEAVTLAADYEGDIDEAQRQDVHLMSVLTFLTGAEQSDPAKHWRFTNGTNDGDLGGVAAMTMNEILKAKGMDTEYRLIWGQGHGSVDYTIDDYIAYVDSICR